MGKKPGPFLRVDSILGHYLSSVEKTGYSSHTFMRQSFEEGSQMSKVLKITNRLVLVLGLIVLSFRPSSSNYVPPGTFHQHSTAFSHTTSICQRTPLSHRSRDMRSSFQRNEDKRRLPVAVVAVPAADVFAFNVPFNLGTSAVPQYSVLSLTRTVVLRI
jgi:hypothetical protein